MVIVDIIGIAEQFIYKDSFPPFQVVQMYVRILIVGPSAYMATMVIFYMNFE